jgi:hypothetical protein
MKLQDIGLWGGLNLVWVGGIFAEDCHCFNQMVLILPFALVDMVAGRLGSSRGTYCWAQES